MNDDMRKEYDFSDAIKSPIPKKIKEQKVVTINGELVNIIDLQKKGKHNSK